MNDEQILKLKQLKELLDAGIINQEDFDNQKEKILANDSATTQASPSDDAATQAVSSVTGTQPKSPTDPYAASKELKQKEKALAKAEKLAARRSKPFYKKVWFWIVIVIIFLIIISAATSDVDSTSDSDQSQTQTESQADNKVTALAAQYSGSTEAGVTLSTDNSDIAVTATYEDGSSEEISDWEIAESKTLKAGKDTTVQIQYEDVTCDLTVTCTTQTKKQYKKSCESVEYTAIARNPDSYIGKNIKFYGQVIQVMESGNDVTLRIATKEEEYLGYYDDVVLVAYTYADGDSKILEDDMITVWGECLGTTTYESVLGGDITIPSMSAKYVKIESAE
ncbi:SHOCT domain-containing protein [Eubacterium oxidoreducens]|uniref:Short C-terminal domain-containing protein n=1 Tax=Eubacterium oxidoreducens TaxID=1732 RepID=A0A1G6AVX9_EUBOX|nr:SHOCT domain-containing protein [Eubacterium oxidoreducens]SDB12550.1 Short C-terminal domain-containing protein [Eubacterium oxidoreducens]